MKEGIRKYMKWLLPILFIGYTFTVSLFEHTHIIDGVIIIHSHPFKSLPDAASHQHTVAQLQLFHFLTHFSAPEGAVHPLTLYLAFGLLGLLAVPMYIRNAAWQDKSGFSRRAPPAYLSY